MITPDKRNSKVTLPFDIEQKFAYDGLGRTKEISLGENLVKDIYYQKFGDHATNRVSTVWYGVNGVRKDSLKYTYDKAGNITTICENGVVITRYVYDGLNRLISENNSQLNQKIKYEYDHAGNIVCKSVNGQKFKYSYPISGWRDQLLSYNGEVCEYDAIGNPTKYRNRNLVWQGRRLISYGKDGKQATYTYDANNVRTSKTVTENGVERISSKYIYDGNTLVAEQRNGSWIYYLYGVDGVAGFRYNGVTYLYRKNIQGDITHIYTEDGQQVAHYAYDAFGNVKELQENSAISQLNPFRYRGDYYDTETGLYYLISRYYDPETGRFISADSIEYLDPETLGGLNLYAYCGNNPVMYVDPTGEAFLLFLVAALIGGIVSFAASAATQAIFNDGHVNWGVAAIDGLFGAIAGALWMVPGLGPVATGFINAGLTAVNGIITTGIENDWQYTWKDVITIASSATLSGLVSGYARNVFFANRGYELLTKSHKLVGTISQRIVSSYYNNDASKIFSTSLRSAASQMFKNLFKVNFGKGFYKDWIITGLQSVFNISFSRGVNSLRW